MWRTTAESENRLFKIFCFIIFLTSSSSSLARACLPAPHFLIPAWQPGMCVLSNTAAHPVSIPQFGRVCLRWDIRFLAVDNYLTWGVLWGGTQHKVAHFLQLRIVLNRFLIVPLRLYVWTYPVRCPMNDFKTGMSINECATYISTDCAPEGIRCFLRARSASVWTITSVEGFPGKWIDTGCFTHHLSTKTKRKYNV